MSRFTLHNMDALMMLGGVQSESVQTCITSPPYWQLRDYGVDGQLGLEVTPEAYVSALVAVFAEVRRVLKDGGTLWVNLGDGYFGAGSTTLQSNDAAPYAAKSTMAGTHPGGSAGRRPVKPREHPTLKAKDLIGLPWRLAFALQDQGWWLRQDIIWSKPNPMPRPDRDRCTTAHEYIFLLSKSARYLFDHTAIQEAGEGGVARNKRSVWTVATRGGADTNFATYPPELVRPPILASTRPGDLVLDPFAGTCTTGAVALQEGRRFLGSELSPQTAEVGRRRLAEVERQASLFHRMPEVRP